MSLVKFTDVFLRNLKPPPSGRTEFSDLSCRGLCLRVGRDGDKTFSFRARPPRGGTPQRLTLGVYPDLSLRDARLRADGLRSEIAAGKNPFEKRDERPRTFAGLAERYMTEHARRFKRSAAKDERNLRLHILPRWEKRECDTISRADVIALVEQLVAAGKPTLANHVHRLISKIFAFAMDVALLNQNPAARLRLRGAARIKSRVLSDDEIRFFWRRVVESPIGRSTGLALRLVLATGVRPGEAAGMARGEIEFDDGGAPVGWTIPAARMKGGRAHYVPLSQVAAAIVVEALTLAGDSPFAFPSDAERGHIGNSTLSRVMGKLQQSAPDSWAADPPTPHDLRRTATTRLAMAGVPAEDVAAILAHKRSDVTAVHYDQYRRSAEKRAGLDRWSRLLTEIFDPQPATNVVALR